ncbi:hypothetical protein WCE37_03695 [Luteimonas sp. MJ250]|uniref:hypothetical protein n=1 Tax=Luteimonas sp. MJ250 TaxID=3129236 RepID=UPI0031BA4C5C
MPTPLIPQEVLLLERYSSKEQFGQMRDTWEALVTHCDNCLDRFMRNLPPDYRGRPQPLQPDVVWGELVIRNFRDTLLSLYDSYIQLSHGNAHALDDAHRVANDVRGQREFSTEWFDEVEAGARDRYYDLLYHAGRLADSIWRTSGAYWIQGTLTSRFNPDSRGPLPDLAQWPKYRLNPDVNVGTDEPVPHTGIYLPSIDDSCAQFLIEGDPADQANIGYDPKRMQNAGRAPTRWILVERVPGEFVDDPLADLLGGSVDVRVARVPAGLVCPRAGWWQTPANAGARRYFKQGDIFPKIENSDYGDTFWQWAQDQSDPRL